MKIWKETGYDSFADGIFENGGQNIYVSGKGVLQRIFHYDVDKDGYIDLVYFNSQDMDERPPVYVVHNPLGKADIRELPTDGGAYCGAIGDLNGDGYDDLVIGRQNNGRHSDLTALIYYGAAGGLSERYKLELPVPACRAAAMGDFNGDGLPDLVFGSKGKLRIFFQYREGFLPGKYSDLNIDVTHILACDFDKDGYTDLFIRVNNGRPRILWGGKEGISLDNYSLVGGDDPPAGEIVEGSTEGRIDFAEGWVPKVVFLNSVPHAFREEKNKACFYPVYEDRSIGTPLEIECAGAISAASGDINAGGREDIVIVTCSNRDIEEFSWIYWGTGNGYDNLHRTPLATISARDVVISDLEGEGCSSIVICQGRTDITNDTESLLYRVGKDGKVREPLRFSTHDASAVLVGKTCDDAASQLVFINHTGGRQRGDVPIYIYHGSAEGFSDNKRTELPGWSAPSGACCDFNDDGWADILVCNCSEDARHLDPGSYLYWGGPDGFNADNKLVVPTFRGYSCAVGDFRHTGYLDMAVVGFNNARLLIYRGGAGGFDLENPQKLLLDPSLKEYLPYDYRCQEPQRISGYYASERALQYSEPRLIFAADFNKDGWLDIVVTQIYGRKCAILWGGPGGYSIENATWLAAEGTAYVTAADLTGNGYLDLIIGGFQCTSKNWRFDSYIYIYWGGADGFHEHKRTQLPAHGCTSIAVADFNNDGILDIFATSYHSGRDRDLDAYLYWGSPGGVYTAKNCSRLFTHSSCGCLAADFNEDGWIDLAVANHKTYGNHKGDSHVWWNGPEGFSERSRTFLPALGPHGMIPVNPGNIMDRAPEEYYISSSFKLEEGMSVVKVFWAAETPPKTWVRIQLRFAGCREDLSKRAWLGADGENTWLDNNQSFCGREYAGQWVQYRLALGAVNGGSTPRVKEVNIVYDAV